MDARISMPKIRVWWVLPLAAVLAVLPVVFHGKYFATVMIFIGLNTMLALGLNLLMGYAGQVSLGHAAFFGIGAYTSAILTTKLGISPWLGLPAAIVVTALISYLIGKPTLRLSGHYLAMATLGFGIIAQVVFKNYDSLTGGTSGIIFIPPFSIAGRELADDRSYYYLVWVFVLILLVVSYNLVNSRVGRALRAVHGSETAAQCAGVDTAKYKMHVFVLSGIYSGLAGALYAHYVRCVNPDPFGFAFSIELLVMVVVGGVASIGGALVGAAAVTILSESLRQVQEYDTLVYGLILIAMVVYMPSGLVKAGAVLGDRIRAISMNRKARGGAS